ncbi:MAG: hypothetical protein HZB57_02905 [Gammaproteobacteria bacterium]|nr:hypothetical protein [Gammaproteobacteria bacterium]
MMQGLAAFAMSTRWRAIVVATLSAAAAWLLPPLTSPLVYLGGAVVGLVTLRLGAVQGLSVLVAGGVALGVLGVISGGLALPMIAGAWVLWLPVWALGLLLRSTRSLALSLQAAATVGVLLVGLAYLWLGSPEAWWAPRLDAVLAPVFAAQGLNAGDYLPDMARWMTALSVTALILGVLMSLLLARAWQAGLYNPGGFAAEFRSLRLGRNFAVASMALVVCAMLLDGGVAQMLTDAMVTLLVIYVLQGLALAHAVVHSTQAHRGWLIGLYAVLLVAAPEFMPLLALLGWMDAWIDFRARLGRSV